MNPSNLFRYSLNTHFLPKNLAKFSLSRRFIHSLTGSDFNFNTKYIAGNSGILFYNNKCVLYRNQVDTIINLDNLNVTYTRYSTSQEKRVTWEDHEDIAELLFQQFRDTNPLSLRFTDLHEMVENVVRNHFFCEISGECSEGALEKIQMTWLELYEQD